MVEIVATKLKTVAPMRDQWNTFIQKYVEYQDHIQAYQHAYPLASRKTAATKGKELLKRNEVWNAIVQKQQHRASVVSEAKGVITAKDVLSMVDVLSENDIATELEMDIYLTKMMKGEILEERILVVGGVATKVKVAPDINTRINAMDKLYRRKGAYLNTGKDKGDKKPGTESIEELKIILEQNLKMLE